MFNPDDIPAFLLSLALNACLVWLSFLVARTVKKKDKFGAGLIGVWLVVALVLRVGIDVELFRMVRDCPRAFPESSITPAASDPSARTSLQRR